jgi:hypothetical protein
MSTNRSLVTTQSAILALALLAAAACDKKPTQGSAPSQPQTCAQKATAMLPKCSGVGDAAAQRACVSTLTSAASADTEELCKLALDSVTKTYSISP